ncbi:MAG: hypothetical protein ABIO04_03250 [Ferruginibacter sp.]
MKLFLRSLVIVLAMIPAISFAQTSKAATWPEMKRFHAVMAGTFHPAEEGNFMPLRSKADSLLVAAKAWQVSDIPANYKPVETKETLEKLVEQCKLITSAVEAKADDKQLLGLITEAHEIFHKVAGECKKAE